MACFYAEAELINAISIGDTNLILITYNDLLYQIEKSIQNIELIEEIDEETSAKKIAAEMFYLYKTIYENEYNEIIRICFIPDEEYPSRRLPVLSYCQPSRYDSQ